MRLVCCNEVCCNEAELAGEWRSLAESCPNGGSKSEMDVKWPAYWINCVVRIAGCAGVSKGRSVDVPVDG